ncbi:SPFH/Band 7/PHB domain protein [Candidatus Dojkabacteria bacterium]|uniref:SPFH/Band 7/PHB domain protein n=1 Tax=Candidatus Dojkabacteria bacterium TaxID=2099670 RepID=A0A955RI91_9BACT|nr:SPFH/Band 7/PHB domain protein [Candidatus Dojkabacteria bacterium]
MSIELIILLIILLIAVAFLTRSIRIVGQTEKGLVLRLGKYVRTVNPGLVIVLPVVETIVKVDMREQVINVDPQKVITEDNVTVTVDGVVYYKVVDPVKSEFEVQDFGYACTTLAQTNLRNLIGDKSLDQTLTARDEINTNLREVLDEATNGWGVKVTRVELQKIDPPADITDAMSRQMKAERDRRAVILEAEGVKRSRILEAEGAREADILKAEGTAKAVTINAEAEAKAIEMVSIASEKFFLERAEKARKLAVLENVLSDQTKYVIPADSDLLNVLGLDSKDTKVLPIKKN